MSQFGTMNDTDVAAVKARLIQQIKEMSDAEIEIAAKSEDSRLLHRQCLQGTCGCTRLYRCSPGRMGSESRQESIRGL